MINQGIKFMQTSYYFSLLWLISLSLLTACSSSKNRTHFYSLSSVAEVAELKQESAHLPALSLGVGPVHIPRLLRRPQLVLRKNTTEVELVEMHQWGGSLREDISNTLSRNLSILANSNYIETYPWKHNNQPDFRIRVKIERLDGDLGKTLTLKARWSLLKKNKLLKTEYSTINVMPKGNSYNAYVAAQSEAIYKLSQIMFSHLHH
jgi:uncharacterized lipoprotein YmbA